MIPASYLYKDAFQKAFYDPDIDQAIARHRSSRNGRHAFSWLRRWPADAVARSATDDRPPTGF